MDELSMSEARKRFSELLDAVERGDSITITRRGKEVARLVPSGQETTRPLPDLSEFRATIEIKGEPLSQTVIEARREERY